MSLTSLRQTLLRIFVVLLLLCSGSFADGAHRYRLVRPDELRGLSRESVLILQKDLRIIYGSDPEWRRNDLVDSAALADGRIGTYTHAWVQRFCVDFRLPSEGALGTALRPAMARVVAFEERHPAELRLLTDADILRWTRGLPLSEQSEIDRTLASGSEEKLLDLAYRYQKTRTVEPSHLPAQIFSYSLEPTALSHLQTRDDLLKVLKAVRFPLQPPFDALRRSVRESMGTDTAHFPDVWERIGEIIDQWPEDTAVFSEYGFDDSEQQAIASALDVPQIPAAVVQRLSEIQGVEYADPGQLREAALAKFKAAVGICIGDVPGDNIYLHRLRMDSAEFAAMDSAFRLQATQDASSSRRNLILEDLGLIENLRVQDLHCAEYDQSLGDQAVERLYERFLETGIDLQAPHVRNFVRPIPSVWKGDQCGCLRKDLSGTVYAFYPPPRDTQARQIDFSLVSRIAYYGIGFDGEGKLHYLNNSTSVPGAFDARDRSRREFVREAHRHGTQVDWVLAKDDWKDDWMRLRPSERSALLEKVAQNLVRHLTKPLSDAFSQARPWLSSVQTRPDTRGDGVIVFFRNYPSDGEIEGSSQIFSAFVRRLQLLLARAGGSYHVSILLTQGQLEGGTEAFAATRLLSLLDTAALLSDPGRDTGLPVRPRLGFGRTGSVDGLSLGRAGIGGQLLVLLDERTSYSKKRLRSFLEDALHGSDRVKLLRATVPVLNFDHRNWGQLGDDLIYAKDNFGGVGFWNFLDTGGTNTANSCAASQSLFRCLELNYLDGPAPDHGATGLAAFPPWLERLVCPNRLIIRTMILFLMLLLLVFGLLSVFVDRVRRRVRPVFAFLLSAFVLPPLFLFLLLVVYDPDLAYLTEGKGPLIVAVLLLVAGFLGTAIFLQRRRVLPSRPALRAFLEEHK